MEMKVKQIPPKYALAFAFAFLLLTPRNIFVFMLKVKLIPPDVLFAFRNSEGDQFRNHIVSPSLAW